ncbi:DNA-processing protein DprA [Marinimicrobium sp. ABcell2]|uniref:DNA-processing protein DprA n=1 Tax=Marinimicrobium sp. ABcell2 TaxID=3069751 RepID=UPI0027B64251|nr:DNA-processing protein DprA [Marinimicrobium sp. ABcell2]MDQ2077070.1 DNA-processing protein DprA [Marinimicrobium sp. ABcell2]
MDNTLQAILLLQRLPGMGGPVGYWRLVELFGSPLAVMDESLTVLGKVLKAPALEALGDYRRDPLDSDMGRLLASDMAWLAQHPDVHLLPLGSPDYPPLLREIPRPPPLLYVRGDPSILSLPQLAVVGSRNPTPGGRDNARQFARFLAGNGFAITSGLALGVDGAAHVGALEAEGRTIAIMGTGIDRLYPSRHKTLAEQIVAGGGALVTEFPLGAKSQRSHFPQRNRVISGLSAGTLVVEAAIKSGSLITARYALQHGREVFAIPGSIHNPLARGCHSLIRQGATLVETAQDIVEELGGMLGYQHTLLPPENEPAFDLSVFSADERAVLEALGHDPQTLDSLLDRGNMEVGSLAASLISLELKGAVTETPNGYVRTLELTPSVS